MKTARAWLGVTNATTLYIEPGSPWENGYNESVNGRLRDECVKTELLWTTREARAVIKMWWRQNNTVRPHPSLNYRPPAPDAVLPADPACGSWGCGWIGLPSGPLVQSDSTWLRPH